MTLLRHVPLPSFLVPGKLYLSSMPGNYQPLEVFLDEIRAEGIGHILCLVCDEEIEDYAPNYLAAIRSGGIPAKLWRHDIPDHGLPENPEELEQVIASMHQLLSIGESVLIHCAGGVGRTGLVSIMLLVRLGFSPSVASRTIRQAGSAPDTQEQWELL